MKRDTVQEGRIALATATRSTKGVGLKGEEEIGFPRQAGLTRD